MSPLLLGLDVLLPLLLGAAVPGEVLAVEGLDSEAVDSGLVQPDLAGTWRMTVTVVTAASVPVLGDLVLVSEKTNLAQVRREDGVWVQKHSSCSVAVNSAALVQTVIPAAFVASLPKKVYTPTVWEEDGQWRYEVLLPADHLGFDPSTPMPESAGPDVVDTDLDGKPGVTVLIRVPLMADVEGYMVQDSETRLDGVIDADRVSGATEMVVLKSAIVGASNPLFTHQPTVKAVPGASTFVMERLPEGSTCKDL